MKKSVLSMLVLFLIAPTFILHCNASDASEKPSVNAHGAILMDAKTGRVLWGKNEHEPLAMASTTKIMTAILTLESGRLDETVTVSRRAAAAPRMKMHLTPGERIRLGDLLLALMLESSNDAAVAIAEHLNGSVEEFCVAMTQKAREIGAMNTVYETPNGLDAGNHHSTAYDLALITRYALEVPGFIRLTNTPSAHFSSDKRSYSMGNKNRLLNEYVGANGVKTGFTNKAGHCFVGAAMRVIDGEEMQLIAVALASGWGDRGRNQKYADSKEILDYGFNHYEYETLLTALETAGSISILRSRTPIMEYLFAEGIYLPLNANEKGKTRIDITVPDNIKAPVRTGDVVGSASLYIGDEIYTEIPLLAAGCAARHDLKTSLEKVMNAFIMQFTEHPVDVILPEWEE
ncbi:MAG: D-alanyl-D-alanine carboxypeptidase [Defluviitaleaceae bacterium]|nr:D-alanyl-D-alanine carboxypeptidase [Defluviitaleaceae bacterium]